MFNIHTLNAISNKGTDRLPADKYNVGAPIDSADAILVRSAKMHDMVLPESVLAIGRAGAGVNNIPVDKMSEQGVVVFNAPGANANAVKELVVAGMLMSIRNLGAAWDFARGLSGTDEEIHKAVEAGKKDFVGFELPGRTLGVIGLGAIGVRVANAAKALGMRVIGFDPGISIERAWELSPEVHQASSVDEVLAKADFVSFHVPLIDATRNLINAERLAFMKENVVVLNFAREGIVDEAAMVAALDAGKAHAYVCDFPSNLTKNHPRCLTFPHLGASTGEAEDNCAIMVVDQIKDYLENGNIRNSVNFPEVRMARSGVQRLAIANRNMPDMVGQISHILGKSNVNIERLTNESRKQVAYTLIDLDSPISDDTLAALRGINGILRIRVL
ncbi:MAG: 3-phosphoglycerate dehydrogenase [Halothiobacillus sp. 14-56-357]|jgi:D-3-phosphoglycerate dehydrogenase|uniref:phosphoglycerate dehydrogenase n=1 Tax=Halothiobacillus sp. 15-55-196 TaxID=1970382 RepID=UPI000BD0E369|nr:phosphoglycerate dehydrogenase [Halothiobacillus sp. 15-55-196]OZB37474.1 MAG: 3-phosphoglycerate dehydrogenase [Halothiobacillus sp. 15-55-196]OZB57689.1 MAG: 3-phosphoglycerate dehydrogenase [Halothiobacillus sp. 14-56-357]OZB79514.1 MAG: 3-phosphoglycerate dehydrogenase [Halothiobacillus sp. 13-55-115]